MFKIEDIPSSSQDLDLLSLESAELLSVVGNEFNISTYLINDPSTEETVDVADLKYNPDKLLKYTPIAPRGPPERKNMSEKCNFSVEIDGSFTQRKKFLYSHLLNRIYIDMNCNFSVNFNWDMSKVPERAMYIRATVVFSDPDQAEKRVQRCLQHAHVSSNAGTTNEVTIKNVLRSARELQDPNVYYCGNPSETDCWYSVVVLLNGPTGHAYHFVCKNSCSSGINRRPIDIIFTLEDSIGTVYGRQSVGARVCSCPRRDKKQQEEEHQAAGGKRSAEPPKKEKIPPKKIKMEVTDDENVVVTLPKIEILGPRAALLSLKVALDMMATKRAASNQEQPIEHLDRCIENIKKIIETLQKKYKLNPI